jgi:hypothetical protein
VAMFVIRSGRNKQSLQKTFHSRFLPSFGSFGQTVSEEQNLKNQPFRNKNRLWRPRLLTNRDEMSNLYREPSIDASYQVSDHLAKQFQEEAFKKSIIQKKEFSVVAIFVRCFLPSFGSIGQSVSEEKNFKNQPIRNKNRLWRP